MPVLSVGPIMSEKEREQQPKIKIQDRRRFDTEGNEREDRPDSNDASQGAPAPGRAAGAGPDFKIEDGKAADALPEITFNSFVISLATQAMMQLGEIKPPAGVDIPVDRQAAKQTIDILTMLDEKTKGNLQQEEAQLLEEILHNLRISFVKRA